MTASGGVDGGYFRVGHGGMCMKFAESESKYMYLSAAVDHWCGSLLKWLSLGDEVVCYRSRSSDII